ncbi:GTP-binding protein [Reyranella sp.]|uniref:CobW family GTP-binding protein n=1 Tax=Reyranella sp. TaxID=1929291 RepID=UPI0025EBDC36|nr:GTP-binding protein [Reyranella sp.]
MIPFTVIGGFLGAGKTTLLNRLLRETVDRRFAVLVNDFGALDIDGRLVAEHGGDTVALANGCLCCTIGDSLVTTLLGLLERPERFDHIVVEASGVADPGRIADLAGLEPRLERDGVIVMVDAAEVRERAADGRLTDTVERQIRAADLLVLNKVDIASDLEATRHWLCQQVTAPIFEACHASVPLDLLFGLDRHGVTADVAPSSNFASWSYTWREPVPRKALMDLLRDARQGVLRAKGIVRFDDAPDRRFTVHLVGRRLDVRDEGPWGDMPDSRLVLLGLRPMLGCLQRE